MGGIESKAEMRNQHQRDVEDDRRRRIETGDRNQRDPDEVARKNLEMLHVKIAEMENYNNEQQDDMTACNILHDFHTLRMDFNGFTDVYAYDLQHATLTKVASKMRRRKALKEIKAAFNTFYRTARNLKNKYSSAKLQMPLDEVMESAKSIDISIAEIEESITEYMDLVEKTPHSDEVKETMKECHADVEKAIESIDETVASLEELMRKIHNKLECEHERDLCENCEILDVTKVLNNVPYNNLDISKPQESLCLTEEMIKKMRLQSERKVKKKLKHSAKQLFLTDRCLEKIRTELLEFIRNRYKTWKLGNSMENRAAVLFHYTKIESELNRFERRIIRRYLENEEDEGAEKGEKKKLKHEKRWKKCDKNLEYHRRNQQESIEEAKAVAENFEKCLRSGEEFAIKKHELSTNLVLIMFLIFSVYNSIKELCVAEEQSRNEQFHAFEKFYLGFVDWIFLGFITIEDNETILPSDWGENLLSRLTTFQSPLVEFSSDLRNE